jgi:hypothetical protein
MALFPQYTGRLIDLLALQGGSYGTVLLDQDLATQQDAGEVCVGLQKLAQRFILTFFTIKGSIAYNTNAGTNFMSSLQQGQIQTESSLLSYFTLAEQDARRQLLAEQLSTDPTDEQYQSAVLTGSSIGNPPGTVQLQITLTSVAGSTAQFIFPIQVLPS